MAASSVKILLIEDNPAEARFLQEILQQTKLRQFSLVHVKRLADALVELGKCKVLSSYDVILLDLTLPDSQGLASLPRLLQQAPSLPIVVLTNTNDDELAIEAVRQGAQDYLVKRYINAELLIRSLCYAIERKQVAESLRAMNQTLEIQAQENATQLDKVKQLNQFRSEFVSMLSHDFRSPLTTILLATGLLQNSEQKLTKEQKIAHFQHINSAIKSMAQLLDEVSLVGKADAGKLECKLTLLDIEKFCRQLVAEAQLSINAKHLILTFTSGGTAGKALCDEGLLRHILTNLLGNAIKYSPPNSTVRFESIAQARSLIFQIQDEGIGIPQEEQQLMFQPFHRASNVGTIPGTGLGLAIVKKCVEACNGQIWLKSEVGVGTTFTVTLPLIEVAV